MPERQRRVLTVFGVVLFVLGIGLGIWAVASKQGEVRIGNRAWSPDGQRLVFAWNTNLYTVDLKGISLHALSSVNGQYLEPAWSPVGDSIVSMFRQSRAAKYALWVIESSGQNSKRVMPQEPLDEYYPRWSPDGKWLGFYRTGVYDGSPSEYGYGRFSLTDFNNVYEQPETLSITDALEWSPDSKEVAFAGFNGTAWNIYSLAPNGTGLQRLTDSSYDSSPAWSPDGSQLVFYSERDTQQNWNGSIYRLDLRSRNITRITGVLNRTVRVEWSPNGRKIALVAYNYPPDRTDLYLMSANGSNLGMISTDVGELISWSPDGRFFAFTASNYLVILDTSTNNILLKYHPRLLESVLSFLPISTAEGIALGSLLLGPLFTVPSILVRRPGYQHPILRYAQAALRAYLTFVGYTFGFVVLAACLAFLYVAITGIVSH